MNNKGLIITASSLLVVIIGLIMYIAWWADDVAYKKAVQANTIDSYRAFLSRYPNSEFAADIQLRFDELDYRKVRNSRSERSYNDYLREHPHSLYVDSVKFFLEDCVYARAMSSTDVLLCRSFIEVYPNSPHVADIRKKMDDIEKEFYNQNINLSVDKVSSYNINEYFRLFPNGKYTDKVNAKNNEVKDYDAYQSAQKSDTKDAWQRYLDSHPNGKYKSQAKAKIKEYEEREYYLNNSLANGAQPYRNHYGSNYSESYGMSKVTVTAPYSRDVVVTARKSSGVVEGHVYVRASRTTTFYIPSGTYTISFYYGNGWYPKKQITGKHGTVYGGFLSNEYVDKDKDVYFPANSGYSYTLQMVQGGNFSTTPSSTYEMF